MQFSIPVRTSAELPYATLHGPSSHKFPSGSASVADALRVARVFAFQLLECDLLRHHVCCRIRGLLRRSDVPNPCSCIPFLAACCKQTWARVGAAAVARRHRWLQQARVCVRLRDAQQSSEKMITENFNLEHDAEIDEALQTILACPYFSSILTDDPIGIVKDDVADHLAGHQALSGKVRFGGSSCWILSPACTL